MTETQTQIPKIHFDSAGLIADLFAKVVSPIDNKLKDMAPHQLILATAAVYFLYNQYHNPWLFRAYRGFYSKTPQQRGLDLAFNIARYLPVVQRYLKQELDKNLQSTREKLAEHRSKMNLQTSLPITAMSTEGILDEFDINLGDCLYNFADASKDDRTF